MERQGNPAVRWGLIFGGALILVELINTGIEYATGALTAAPTAPSLGSMNLGASLVQGCIVFLIEIALYFVAGLMAARENGRVGTGAIAGVIAGAMVGVVGAIITVFRLLLGPTGAVPSAGSNLTPEQYHSILVIGALFGSVVVLAITIGIGAGIAALGGLVGKSQFERAHPAQPMMESYYTPMAPAPGYPVHPQGAYPPVPGSVPPPAQNPEGYPPQNPEPYPQQYPPQYPYPPQTPPQQQ